MNAFPHFLTEIDGQTVHFVHVPSAERGRDAAAAGAHLPGLVPRLPRHDRPADRPGRPRRPSRGRVLRRHPVDAGLRLLHPGGRPRLDDGPGRPHLRHPDAAARLRRRTARTAATAARWSPASSACSTRQGFLGAARAPAVLVPLRRPGRVREARPEDYAALEHLEWFQSVGGYNAMNASRPQTIAVGLSDSPGRPARLQRAVRDLRQRHQPGHAASRSSPRSRCTGSPTPRPRTVRYHYEEARAGRRAAGQHGAVPASPCSPTTSRRSGRSPSATTPTSCTGPVRHRRPLRRPGAPGRHRRRPAHVLLRERDDRCGRTPARSRLT